MRDDRLDNNGTQTQATPAIDGSHIKGRKALQASRIVSVKARRDMHGDTDLQVVEMSDNTMAADVLKLAKLDPPPKTQLYLQRRINRSYRLTFQHNSFSASLGEACFVLLSWGLPRLHNCFKLIVLRNN